MQFARCEVDDCKKFLEHFFCNIMTDNKCDTVIYVVSLDCSAYPAYSLSLYEKLLITTAVDDSLICFCFSEKIIASPAEPRYGLPWQTV